MDAAFGEDGCFLKNEASAVLSRRKRRGEKERQENAGEGNEGDPKQDRGLTPEWLSILPQSSQALPAVAPDARLQGNLHRAHLIFFRQSFSGKGKERAVIL